jgi:hypothetical protein
MDVDVRLAAMDAAGIDVQLLSPNPLTSFGRLDARDAARYARVHNDALAELAGEHPGRLLAAAQLPVQDVGASVAEARRAVRDLGMAAVHVDTDPAGRTLDDPELDPLYAALVDLDVPLFVHPSPLGEHGPPTTRDCAASTSTCSSGSPGTRRSPSPRWSSAGCWSATPGSTSASATAAAPRRSSPAGSPAPSRCGPGRARRCAGTGSTTTTGGCGSTPTSTTPPRWTCS